MKTLGFLFFALSLITRNAYPSEVRFPQSIRFEDRAACAVDSKKPTQSAFLIVDSYNAGKLIDSWLKGANTPESRSMTVDQGLKLLRLSLTETWMTVIQELISGKLPLLKGPQANDDSLYSKAQKSCGKRFPCPEMERYLSTVFQKWKNLPANQPGKSAGASCIYVKRFSDLQSNWNHDRPDQALLQKIALAQNDEQNLFTDCFDESDSLDSRRFVLQFDVSGINNRVWDQMGFDFWYSAKVYFSHAWRHPELILDADHELAPLFKNLAIEQMVQLVSLGCKSIDRPECTQSQVSMDVYRSLGQLGNQTELDRPLPNRPDEQLLNNPLDQHHGDSAVLPEDENADEWLTGYQSRIIQYRGVLKQKLLLAVSQFELLSSSITPGGISKQLEALKQAMANDPILYQKMEVLCTEIDVAVRPDLNLLEGRFNSTLEIPKFKMLVESASDEQLGGMINFYTSIAKATFAVCEEIRTEKLWKQSVPIAQTSYSAWYRDLSGTWDAPVDTDAPSTPDFLGMGNIFNTSNSPSAAFLSQEKISANGFPEFSTVCADASDCVRMLLKSMVDLYAVSSWADALMPINDLIQSPNLANQWSSATACQVYDPWFATKQATVGLLTDIVTTVVTGFEPIPLYLSVQPKHRDVKRFTPDPKGDDVFLKPVKQKGSADVTIGIDLGPWTGVPCALVFSPTSSRPSLGGYYSVAGIHAAACAGSDNNRLVIQDGSSTGDNQKKSFSGCVMCYINPYAGARSIATFASMDYPWAKIAVGVVFSGISFAKKMSNPVDVPHRYRVDLDDVANTYKKYSFIPKHCVWRLSRGMACQHVFLNKKERQERRK